MSDILVTTQSLSAVDWSQLPAPLNDGAANHLEGLALPSISLPATDGSLIDLSLLPGLTVVYAYPMTGRPGATLPRDWDMIPGARGCTPQSCAFRDHYSELKANGVIHLFGLSVQTTEYQLEAATRLHLPFPLLSDAAYKFTDHLNLPCFESEGVRLLKRLTLIVRDGRIMKVFYPVFPPDQNAVDVLTWLSENRE